MKPKIHLLTRADDAGSCRSANEAILECVEAGIIKNVSFMAVGPEIEHAVELLRGRGDIAYGFHICLNAEWDAVKWKPLTGSRVLTDEHGDFLPFPADTRAAIKRETQAAYEPTGHYFPEPADVWGEPDWEIRLQMRELRELGLAISYVDEHMEVSQIGLRATIAALCREHELVDAHSIPALPAIRSSGNGMADLETRLKTAMLDTYVWITHPGKIAPDMDRFQLPNQPPGQIARERDAERELLTDARLPELFARWKVKPIRYDELPKNGNGATCAF